MQIHKHKLLLEMCLKTFITKTRKHKLTEYDKNVPDAYEQYGNVGCNHLWPLGLLLERIHCLTRYSFPFIPSPSLDFFPLDLRPDLEP